jgi:hypothetical protein
MRSERTPLLGEPAAAPVRTVLLVASLSFAAAFLFHSILLFGGDLRGIDWASHHYHYFDWARVSLVEHHTLPLYMADAWVTPNFLGNAESPSLGPLAGLLLLLPTGAYIKLLIVLFTAVGLAGTFFLLRDLAVEPPIAVPIALVFALNGFFVSHLAAGHHWVMGALLLPLFVLWAQRALLGSDLCLGLAAALNAFTIMGGQHQPFIWQNLLFSLLVLLWALQRRAVFPLARWALLLLLSFGLGAVKLLPMLAEFADYAPTARIQGLPPGLLLWTLAKGGQHAGTVVPGVDYAHGAGWWEYAFYVGPLALAAFLFVALDWRAGPPWLDPWPLLRELPVWTTQRAPSRLLFAALFAFTVAAAVGLQLLWSRHGAPGRRPAVLVGVAATLLVGADLFIQSMPWQRGAVGEALASRDHRPRPLVVTTAAGARAELVDFAPNRLVYRVAAPAPARIVFPLRKGERGQQWRIADLPVRSERGKLAVDVPAGSRDIVMVYRPPLFCAGVATSATTLVLLGVVAGGRLRARRRHAARG